MTRETRGPSRATLIRYLFFAGSVEGPGGAQERLDGSGRLEALWGDVRRWAERVGTVLPEPFPPPLPTRDLWVALYPPDGADGWLPVEGGAFQALVRATWVAEALCLGIGVRSPVTAEGDPWSSLRAVVPNLSRAEQGDKLYLGHFDVYAGRVSDEPAARAGASATLKADGELQPSLRMVQLPGSGWLFDADGIPDAAALLTLDTDSAETQAARFLHGTLVQLVLFAAKTDHQLREWGEMRGPLEAAERKLAGILHPPSQPDGTGPAPADTLDQSLQKLQGRVHAVAGAYGEFAAALSGIRRVQHSVAINTINLERCAAASALPSEGPLAALLRDVANKTAQLPIEARFYDVRVEEAEMALRSLQGQAEVLRARLDAQGNKLAAERNERLGDNIHHIRVMQTFLHYIEYFLVSVYFAHLAHMVFTHPSEPASEEHGWSVNWVVIAGALVGLLVAFVLDPEKGKVWRALTGWLRKFREALTGRSRKRRPQEVSK